MKKKSAVCTWREIDTGAWETECKHLVSSFDGDRAKDDELFCMYCGRPVDTIEFSDPDDD